MSWQAGLGIGLSILGILGAIFTGGTSLAAAESVNAALLSTSVFSLVSGSSALIADVTGIASAEIEDTNPKMSAILGWVSFVTGLTSMGTGLVQTARFGRVTAAAENAGEGISLSVLNRTASDREGAGVTYYRAFSIEPHYRKDQSFTSYNIAGYMSDIMGTGEPGLVLHGYSARKIWLGYTPGFTEFSDYGGVRARMFNSAEALATHIHDTFGIDLRTAGEGKPLHLLACYAGGNGGFAQHLATYLKRPVVAYGGATDIVTFKPMDILGNPNAGIFLSLNNNGVRSRIPAEPQVYHPLSDES
jgi:hypothetical protein